MFLSVHKKRATHELLHENQKFIHLKFAKRLYMKQSKLFHFSVHLQMVIGHMCLNIAHSSFQLTTTTIITEKTRV